MLCLICSSNVNGPPITEEPLNEVLVVPKPMWLYSIHTDQFGMNIHSRPAPASQPVLVTFPALACADVRKPLFTKSNFPFTQAAPPLP